MWNFSSFVKGFFFLLQKISFRSSEKKKFWSFLTFRGGKILISFLFQMNPSLTVCFLDTWNFTCQNFFNIFTINYFIRVLNNILPKYFSQNFLSTGVRIGKVWQGCKILPFIAFNVCQCPSMLKAELWALQVFYSKE